MVLAEKIRAPLVSVPTGNDWLGVDELAAMTPAKLVARVEALQPMLAESAAQTEATRRPSDAVFDALRKTGVFYHFVPKRFGGLEFGVNDFIDVVLPLGEACTSTAWVASFCMEHNLIFALFPEEAQEEIFANQPYIVAPATSFPPGRAEAVPGGHRVTGRWAYASGIMNADWAMVQALTDPSDRSSAHLFLVPINEIQVFDTWRMDGLAGTGSNDIAVKDVFVPAHRMMRVVGMNDGTTAGATIHANPLYAMPMATFLALTSALPALGAARGALKHFRERLAAGAPGGAPIERAALHMVLGEVDVDVSAAELLLRDCGREIAAMAETGTANNVALRSQLRARIARVTTMARDALRKMVDASSTSVHALDNPIQRALRDATMTCSHVLHDAMAANELNGRVQLGLSPQNPLI